MKPWRSSACLLVVVASLAGCSGTKTAPLHGKVTLADGSPLKGVIVSFDDATNHVSARGFTAEDGTYVLTTVKTGDGAPVGTYTVTVHHPQPQDSSQPEKKGLFHLRYESRQKSGLECIVKPGDNTFDIKLDKR